MIERAQLILCGGFLLVFVSSLGFGAGIALLRQAVEDKIPG